MLVNIHMSKISKISRIIITDFKNKGNCFLKQKKAGSGPLY
ncbi:hypothetical protein ELI_3836 [Eubacterium callanderi]|uniref:Uncharacterized protein n=1 Tax=Eubacterium callanderi TaxID=53442 RepID=E3GGH8_9FIRM|nr:hypothetical protein ELI_3836 [Eubacterium callanderi]